MPVPPPALSELLSIRLIAWLGGRLNHHWLVEAKAQQLVLRRWSPQPTGSIEYECRLMAGLADKGWPVAVHEEVFEHAGSFWSLARYLPGEPPLHGNIDDQRARGRLLATLHADTALLEGLGPRPGWRRAEEILADTELDSVLSKRESLCPEEVRIVRWHLDRARNRMDDLRLEARSGIPVHGDFAPWNLHFEAGRLTGLLDFEHARNDHRVADFALSWRGKYDAVIEGYEDVAPLEPSERAAIVPVWWAELIEGACHDLRHGKGIDIWTVGKLLARSARMGPDATEKP